MRIPEQLVTGIVGIVIALAVRTTALAGPTNPPSEPKLPSPHAIELARALVAETNDMSQLSARLDARLDDLIGNLRSSYPGGDKVPRSILEVVVRDEFARMEVRLTQAETELYATSFSESQLSDLLVFYKSPAGRAMVAQTPKIKKGTEELALKIGNEVAAEALTETCTKMGCHSRPTPGSPIAAQFAFAGRPWAAMPTSAIATPTASRMGPADPFSSAELHCQVGKQGKLENCVVDWESQPNAGVGAMAIEAAYQCRLKPRLLDGTDPEGLFVQLTMHLAPPPNSPLPRLHYLSTNVLVPLKHVFPAPQPRGP